MNRDIFKWGIGDDASGYTYIADVMKDHGDETVIIDRYITPSNLWEPKGFIKFESFVIDKDSIVDMSNILKRRFIDGK